MKKEEAEIEILEIEIERHLVRSINYQQMFNILVHNNTSEEFANYRSKLQKIWFDLYYENLIKLGYNNDGETISYEFGNFIYDSDYTQDNELESQWWEINRENCRIVAVHGFSAPPQNIRNDDRLRWHGYTLIREYGDNPGKYPFDKGHYIAHSIGGNIDNGIFAQKRSINRGWSEQGKIFRSMEKYALENPGTFVFSRPIYEDGSLHPFFLEYGILKNASEWFVRIFPNRYTYTPFSGKKNLPEWFEKYVEYESAKQKRREKRMESGKLKNI